MPCFLDFRPCAIDDSSNRSHEFLLGLGEEGIGHHIGGRAREADRRP